MLSRDCVLSNVFCWWGWKFCVFVRNESCVWVVMFYGLKIRFFDLCYNE